MVERKTQKQLDKIHGKFYKLYHALKNSQTVLSPAHIQALSEINRADEATVSAFHALGAIIEEEKKYEL